MNLIDFSQKRCAVMQIMITVGVQNMAKRRNGMHAITNDVSHAVAIYSLGLYFVYPFQI